MSNELKQKIADLQHHFTNQPDAAIVKYHSTSELKDGFKSNVQLRQHKLVVDEPKAIGGTDEGASPVELILAALATCQEISYKAYAVALGIPLTSVSVKLTGELDLKGFLGINKDTRPGFQSIYGTVELVSDAPQEKLNELKKIVDAHCPVLDILTNKVPVEVTFEQDKQIKKIV